MRHNSTGIPQRSSSRLNHILRSGRLPATENVQETSKSDGPGERIRACLAQTIFRLKEK